MSPQVGNRKVYSSRNTFEGVKCSNFQVLNKTLFGAYYTTGAVYSSQISLAVLNIITSRQ